jgi:hypothetical protein
MLIAGMLINRATFIGALSLLVPSNNHVLLDADPPSFAAVTSTTSAATTTADDPYYTSFANYV